MSAKTACFPWFQGVNAYAVEDQVVEPAAILPTGQIEVLLDRLGDGPGMLDRFPVHVQDQERAVGRVGKIDGTEPNGIKTAITLRGITP